MFSLRNKIILMTCTIVLFSTLVMIGVGHLHTKQITLDRATQELAVQSRAVASEIRMAFDKMKLDASIIAGTPPVKGIIRSSKNRNIDPLDGSTNKQWRARLATIFKSIITTNPLYTQIRYIGVADNGRELVRVDRKNGEIVVTQPKALQQKGHETYFKRSLNLTPKQVYYSDVTYNREHGVITPDHTPTIRIILPIFYKSKLFGMIVINANYELSIQQVLTGIKLRHPAYVMNYAGDFLEYIPDLEMPRLNLNEFSTRYTPEIIRSVLSSKNSNPVTEIDGSVYVSSTIRLGSLNSESAIAVILYSPKSLLYQQAFTAQYKNLLLGLALLIVTLIGTFYIAKMLTLPMTKMTQSIVAAVQHNASPQLPIQLQDEIGDLARAFDTLTTKIQSNESSLRNIIENIIDGIITFDSQGTIISRNKSCFDIFGYMPGQLIGNNIGKLIPSIMHDINEHHLVGEMFETSGVHKSGREMNIELFLNIITVENSYIYLCIVRDITEKKKLEYMKNEFISVVNHELRTPLTSIQGALGLIQKFAMDELSPKFQELLMVSYRNSERLGLLVNDILDVEKLAAGKMEYQMVEVEMNTFVKEICDRNIGYAEMHQVQYHIEPYEAPIYCQIDKQRFEQVLTNLLSNAAKFSKPGDDVEIILKAVNGDSLEIAVTDHGQGIPEDMQDKVFGRFMQGIESINKKQKGTGLGLYISKALIEAFSGTISFQSKHGIGSTFYVRLPVINKAPSE